jgi:CRP-like cAMP-binding protein
MRWLYATTLERTSSEVPARLAGRLLDLGDLLGRIHQGALEIDLPVAQGDLGRLAGISRESTCKALRSFKSQGLLDYRGRRLRILRPDALERIRCAGRATK